MNVIFIENIKIRAEDGATKCTKSLLQSWICQPGDKVAFFHCGRGQCNERPFLSQYDVGTSANIEAYFKCLKTTD